MMKTITIGFSKSSLKFAPFSWLIMWAQNTTYSHVYLKLHRYDINRDVYYQASHDLVNFMSADVFNGQEKVVEEFTFQVSDDSHTKISQFCYDQLGKPYAVSEIFGMALVIFASKFGIRFSNPIKDGNASFFCSELIAYFLQQCEAIQLPLSIEDMTPKETYALVKSLPSQLS